MQRHLCIVSTMIFATSLSPARNLQASDTSKDTIQSLQLVESRAFDAAVAADRLEVDARDGHLSREHRAEFLNQIREDINQMGKQINALEAEQTSLAPWEREALAKTLPLLSDAAINTEQAIQILNTDGDRLWAEGAYRADTEKVWQDCTHAATMLEDYLKLNHEMRKEEQVRHELGLTGGI